MRMATVVDFAYQTDIPLTMDVNMSEVMTFETQLMVAGVVAGERGIGRYAMDGSCSINFVMEFGMLEGQFDFRGEWGRGGGWKGLWVGRYSQLFDISF